MKISHLFEEMLEKLNLTGLKNIYRKIRYHRIYQTYEGKDIYTLSIKDKSVKFSISDHFSKMTFYKALNNEQFLEQGFLHKLISLSQKNIVFFDVGANIGMYSTIFGVLNKNSSIHSFEMDHHSIEILKRNIQINNLHNVSPVHAAVSNKLGTISYYKYPSDPHPGRELIPSKDDVKNITVDSITLDSYCQSNSVYPDIVKIDVEGSEVKVLKGMDNVLRRGCILFIEVHSKKISKFGNSPDELLEILNKNKYTITELKNFRGINNHIEKPLDMKKKNLMLIAYKDYDLS